MSNQPHQAGHSLDTAAASGSAAASSSSAADRTLLTSYVLEPPEWRAPLLANKSPALYPDFFPGATALYPQLATQSAGHVPGISRDSSAGASGSHFVPVGGVTVSKEDELNETVAKLGFVNKAVVQTENFSAHALIHNKLHNGPSIHALGKIIQRVLERQNTDENLLPNPGPWTYKAPSRVVYNASRLEGWYADLANPSVPLSKLAKNIPSAPSSSVQSGTSTGTGTYTGSTSTSGPVPSASKLTGTAMDKNLDMLINRQVPLYRALWFLQAVGQNDIAQLGKSKNLQVHPILSYSADYTVSFVEALKRQVGEALLPITQTTGTGRLLPGMSVKGRPRNILAEEQGRDRWLAKLNYTLELLSASLDEGMLDRQRLCSLLIQQLQPQTRIQMLWWLSVIIQTTIDDMLATAWMSKALVIVLFEWLQSMAETSPQTDSDTATCEDVARSLMRHIWLTDSDMFLIPHLWSKKSVADQLKSALGIGYGNASDEDLSLWSNLEERAYILLCKRPPRKEVYSSLLVDLPSAPVNAEDSMASQHWTVDSSKVVRLLDEWTDSDSIESITEKLVEASSSRSLPHEIQEPSTVGDSSETWSTGLHPEVIKLLLMWATTTTRCGNHRPYLVTSILGQCLGLPRFSVPAASTTSNATLDDTPSIDIDRFEGLQDCIMQWIDCQEKYLSGKARASSLLEWTSREATLWMCYSLLSSRILDISGLVQKVIARGAADTGNTHGDGIYVQILKDYGGNSNRVALKWQMGRVSISHRNADDGEALESIQARILENLQPFLQQLQTQNDGHQVNLEPLGLENFKARLSTLPVIKRAWILNAWLAPIVDEVTQANQNRVSASVILSLLSLFQTLEAYELLSRFLINVLRNYELSSRTVESLVSVHRVNCLVFAAMQDLPAYASSLFVACQKLNNKGDPGTFVLSELASLGIQHHLSTSQLRALRRNMLHWQTQSSLPSLLPGMLSPAEDDNPSRDLLVDVTSSIRAFCLAYKRRVGDMTEIDKTLAALLSICGAPLDLVGAIMSAMMQLISDLPQEQNTLESLLSLCSAIVRMPYSSSNKPPRRDKVGELGKALESFTPTHAVFVLQLVTRNVLSIQLVLDNVCYPLLLQFSTQATSEPSASVLLDLITSLLLDSDCRDAQSWRVRAARSALYSQKSFPSVYRLGSQLSYLTHNQQDVPWRSQVRQVYERILAQPFFRSAFMKYLEGKSLTSGFPKDTSGGNVVFVWDALVSMVQPCFRTGTDLANDSQDVNSLSTASAFLLHGDMFEPFVTCLGRWFFKVLLLREQRPLTSHSADEPTSKLPRPFVEQCLRYLLEAPQNNSRAQLGMFAEHIGNDLSITMLETLLKKLEQYCHFLRAPSDPQTVEGSLGVLGQIAHVASLIADSWSVMPTSPPDLEDKNLLRNIVQKAADVLSFINSSNTTQSANAIFQTGGINLMAHIVCLVRNCGDAALETTEIMREFTTSLCHYYHNLQIREIQNQYLQDLIGWLLQTMSADSRSTVLKRYQSHASLVGNPRMQSYRKQFSLGPPPLLSCIQSGDERYMMVQKTWAGLSVEPNAFNIDTKGNNEPVDLLKYRCRTRNIERHLQPAYRTMEKGPWSTFDSEIPWNTGSTCQRDFRRSTITQPDLISANQAQALRNRANSQADIRAPLSKNSSAHSNDSAKQPGKEKTAGGHVRDVPPKKRKGIPDVIVVEETSPKKKTKTTNNTIHASTASRQTKHKA